MLPAGSVVPAMSAAALAASPVAEAFVRYCYQRRRVGWPELYDEMCLVATRGLFRGMGRRPPGFSPRKIPARSPMARRRRRWQFRRRSMKRRPQAAAW